MTEIVTEDKTQTVLTYEAISTADGSHFSSLADNWNHAINHQLSSFREQIKSFIQWVLGIEIAFLMIMIICQGWKLGGFSLNDWVFGIFANACLLQTFLLIKCIVSHVFPSDPQKTGWQTERK